MRLSLTFEFDHTRPSLRNDSLMSVSLDWCSPDDRDAGRMNLRVARVGEVSAFAMSSPDGRGVAALRTGGEIEHVAVAASREHDGVGGMRTDLAGDEVANDDPDGTAVFDYQVQHLRAGVHRDRAKLDLMCECLVGAKIELLAGLAAGVKRPRNLRAAEGAVVQQAAVFTREGHALGDALVDDGGAYLRRGGRCWLPASGSRRP